MTKYLMCTGQACCPDVTKAADIFCAYNLEPVVIFDILMHSLQCGQRDEESNPECRVW